MLRVTGIAVVLAFIATPALAEPVSGKIDDPSLRRRIDLIYVESVEGSFPPPPAPVVTCLSRLTVVMKGTRVVFQGRERTLDRLGLVRLPCPVMVLQNPFYATHVDALGRFVIDGLPPGTYTLRVWGEKLSDEENARSWLVTVGEGSVPGRVAWK
jgi:hypothetical protein